MLVDAILNQMSSVSLCYRKAVVDVEHAQVVYAAGSNFIECIFLMKTTKDRTYRDVSSAQIKENIPPFESAAIFAGKLYALLSEA